MLLNTETVNIKANLEFAIPLKIKNTYKNFKPIANTSSYRVFEAESCYTNEKHNTRVLDRSKEFVNQEYNLTATLFVQELLYLQSRYPSSILTNAFAIVDSKIDQ